MRAHACLVRQPNLHAMRLTLSLRLRSSNLSQLTTPPLRLVRVGPRAEDAAPDAHGVGLEGDGGLEVAAHAHAELEPRGVHAEGLRDEVAGLGEHAEGAVVPRRADGHEPVEAQVRARVGGDEGRELQRALARRHAALAVLAGGVDLDHDAEPRVFPLAARGGAGRVQLARELLRVHRLHADEARHPRQQRLALVGLQVPDEAPADVVRELRRLLQQLLRVVLAEVPRARRVRALEQRHGLGLGHRHEPRHRGELRRLRGRRHARQHRRVVRAHVLRRGRLARLRRRRRQRRHVAPGGSRPQPPAPRREGGERQWQRRPRQRRRRGRQQRRPGQPGRHVCVGERGEVGRKSRRPRLKKTHPPRRASRGCCGLRSLK
mmetsp:Transcript_9053/g.26377  ORF Transcript_9053/g.26377 Transcript_9053/m.26377 type:complete len:376 (-) Transcript_9053:56-1183(-)